MPVQSGEELFLNTLSRLHADEQRGLQFVQDVAQAVQDKSIKQALELRGYLTKQEIANLDECFKLLGKQPTRPITRLVEVLAEDFQKEINEIQSPVLKALFALQKVRQVQHMHIAEYAGLVLMAHMMDAPGVAMLLERNLSDKLDFIEQGDELIQEIGRQVFVSRVMQRAA